MYNVIDLSNYLISKCNKEGKSITNLQLQKTLYYIQGYFLKRYNEPAFDAHICHWPYGPVVPEAYFEFNSFGANSIYINDDLINCDIKNSEHRKLVNLVLQKCLDYKIVDLVEKTHKEQPWRQTEKNQEIIVSNIEAYFNQEDPLEIG